MEEDKKAGPVRVAESPTAVGAGPTEEEEMVELGNEEHEGK